MDEHLRKILKFNQSKVPYGAFEGLILPFLKNRSLVTLVGFRFHPCLPLAILGCHPSRCLSQTTQWQCRQHISRIILWGSQKLPSSATLSCAPREMGLQHVLHCTHPRSTMNCCPKNPQEIWLWRLWLKHLATNGSTEFVVFSDVYLYDLYDILQFLLLPIISTL